MTDEHRRHLLSDARSLLVLAAGAFLAALFAVLLTGNPWPDRFLITLRFDPVFLRVGGLDLGWHGVFTALAVGVAVWVGLARARAMGITGPRVGNVVTWAVVGGIVGARLFYVADHLSHFAAHPADVFLAWQGGIAVYGAFIGGIAAGLLAARGSGLPVWRGLDAAAPAMLIGQMIGRLGCFSNGDAWGKATGGQWGVVYQNSHALIPDRLLGVPTHPYPLYEIAAGAALLGLLLWGRRYLAAPGDVFLVAGVGYAVIRFGLSFFRQESAILLGLQEAQLVALATGAISLFLFVARRLRDLP
jgi:phosphatidylglycerol:prolipoprotein diacylglycerol transferase